PRVGPNSIPAGAFASATSGDRCGTHSFLRLLAVGHGFTAWISARSVARGPRDPGCLSGLMQRGTARLPRSFAARSEAIWEDQARARHRVFRPGTDAPG